MPRLIDANKAISAILNVRDNNLHSGYPRSFELSAIRKALRCIEEIPTIEVEPMQHGSIIETIEDGRMKRVFSCCGTDFTKMTCWMMPNYCPNCGAKMDGGAD